MSKHSKNMSSSKCQEQGSKKVEPDNPGNSASESQQENSNELEACQKELEQAKDQYMRTKADFDNYKRRIEKDKAQWYQSAQSALLLDLLNIVDDFDRALEDGRDQELSPELQGWLDGFKLIHKSVQKLLQTYEVKELEQITEFDPQYHEALVQVDSPEHESGHIVEVMQKGYTFKGELLRPAKVTVAR